jgi:hypothetical protein
VSDQKPIDQENLTLAKVIDSRINQKFMCDYGIVKTVSSDGTHVDVTHAAILTLVTGDQLPQTETKDVELIFPASSKFSIKYPVAVGDGVLLIGLKDYLASTLNVQPTPPQAIRHYSQDTLKAIPFSAVPSSPLSSLEIDDNGKWTYLTHGYSVNAQDQKIQLKNTAASIYTALDNFEAAVQTFSSAASQSAITAAGASSISLAAAIVTLLGVMNGTVTSAKTLLSQVMEA